MANLQIKGFSEVIDTGTPTSSAFLLYDDGTDLLKTPAPNAADAIRPVASESEAVTGADNTKIMTPP